MFFFFPHYGSSELEKGGWKQLFAALAAQPRLQRFAAAARSFSRTGAETGKVE